jgi:hypothetical protein
VTPTPIADYGAFYAIVDSSWITSALAVATGVAIVVGVAFSLLRAATGGDSAGVGADDSD